MIIKDPGRGYIMRVSIIIIIILSVPAMCLSSTLHVPGDYSTIQEAIDAANPGDIVLVDPGTYIENINFLGKAITVRSDQGSEVTVIDGGNPIDPDFGSVVLFEMNEGSDSVLEGFTLRNGTGTYESAHEYYYGGGIYCRSSSPTLTGNIITANSADIGGGISCRYDADAEIINNEIHGNITLADGGGGIQCGAGSTPNITGNIIRNNSANLAGGGIRVMHASPEIIDNIISENTTTTFGGGIWCMDSMAKISYNEILENHAGNGSGGIHIGAETDIAIACNRIIDNTVNFSGGGIGVWSSLSTVTVTNNIISKNVAGTYGGGLVFARDAVCTISNNTIHENAAAKGGGIACEEKSELTIVNSILWKNQSSVQGDEIHVGYDSFPSTVTISYSCVMNGMASVYLDPDSTINWDEGMIEDDPLFEYPSIDDYHLTWLSPCINRGDNEGAAPDDMDGDLRPCVGTADMGADEFTGTHPLEASVFSISEPSGGTVDFALFGDTYNAGRNYLVLGSVSGTVPSFPLPGGMETLRLNWDWFTDLALSLLGTPIFENFTGQLDEWGNAAAKLNMPPLPPGTAGITMHYAYCLNNPFDFVSNPVAVEIVD
ncbi:MAG: NosD domain-containing protein [Planctomycetota bacterium]